MHKKKILWNIVAQSSEAVEKTDCIFGKTPPTIARDMTLKNMIMRLQF